MTKKRIHLLYGILVSVSAAVAGICLIVACVNLYDFQAESFTRESVAQAFRPIAIWVYICLALVIGGILLNLLSPAESEKLPVQKQYGTILEKLHQKADITKCDPLLQEKIRKQQALRKTHTVISYVLLGLFGSIALALCTAVIFFYSIHKSAEEVNTAVIIAMTILVPSFVIPFAYAVFAKYFKQRSMIKEIELVKQAIANGHTAQAQVNVPAVQKNNAAKIIRYMILGIAVVILVGGFLFGGTADVLAKAAAICTECVGLG